MVYALCNMTEAIQLVTDIRVFCESDVLGVQIGFTKFQGVFFAKLPSIEYVLTLLKFRGLFGFIKVWGFFYKLSQQSAYLSVKVQQVFHNINIHKARDSFAKLSSINCKIDIHKIQGLFFCKITILGLQINFTKVRGIILQNLHPQLFLAVGSADRLRGHLLVQENAPGLVIRD